MRWPDCYRKGDDKTKWICSCDSFMRGDTQYPDSTASD